MAATLRFLQQSRNRIMSRRRSQKLPLTAQFYQTTNMKLYNLQLNHARIDQQMDRSQCDKKDGCRRVRLQLHPSLNPKLRTTLKLQHILKALPQVQRMLIHWTVHPQRLHNGLRPPTSQEGNTQVTPEPRVISSLMGS